jgi:hypothetical protein
MEDMLLAALEYWREYRTYAHISVEYEVSESQICRTVKWVEETLVKDGTFALPGKKGLLEEKREYHVVLYDCTETPIERSKKTENGVKSG